MKKLYIFDLDGTLLDTLPTIAHYGNAALEKFGFGKIEEDRYRILVGDGRDVLIHRMLAEHGADTPENFAAVGGEYDALYEAEVLYLTKPYDGICGLLRNLAQEGVRLAVLSNKPDNVVRPIVREVFGDVFDLVRGKVADFPTKPNPASALDICTRLGINAEETAFVGDTSVDILTAKNAGFYAVGASWGFRGAKELSDAGADIVVSRAEDILCDFQNRK